MSLAARLTLVLSLMLTVAFTLLTLAHYRAQRQALQAEVDEALELRAQALELELRSRQNPASYDPEVFFQVVDERGQVQLSSPGLEGEVLPDEPVGKPFPAQVRGLPVRLLVHRLDGSSWLKVGESLRLPNQSLSRSVAGLLVTSLCGLLLVLTSTWAVVQNGLRPLRRVARVAQEILDTDDFSRRIPPVPSPDVVGLVARLLNRLMARVHGLLESQKQLLADTSHELRNPLTVMRNNLELLARDLPVEMRQEVADEAFHEVERMTRLVEDLLALSWADQRLPLRNEPVRLDVLARELAERTSRAHPTRRLEFSGDTPVFLAGDRQRLLQAAANLVDNAVRYSDGLIRVRVWSERGQAVLEVEDEGPGIPLDQQEAIFQRFVRLDASRSRASGGTGLGLAIVQAMAQAHGGIVSLDSAPGKGSRFQFRVPLG